MTALFADIGATEGRVDVMVNNAGIQRVGLTETFDPDVWRQVVEVHLFGMFNCTALALPFMKRQGSGVVLSMASTTAIVGVPGRGPYTASKGAISAWTRSLAVEVAEAGIRVNAVAPGQVLTKLVQQGLDDGSIIRDSMLSEVPMRRFGKPEETSPACSASSHRPRRRSSPARPSWSTAAGRSRACATAPTGCARSRLPTRSHGRPGRGRSAARSTVCAHQWRSKRPATIDRGSNHPDR